MRVVELPGRLAILVVRGYQLTVARLLPPSCRFYPSCSQYMIDAIATRGLPRGVLLGVFRLLRCQPLCRGGFDPAPAPRAAGGQP